jgi:hypothetical protein
LAAGPWSGALAAGLTASVVAANGHPVPALSMCPEAVTLGWLVRRVWRPAFGLIFFWGVLGLPLWLVNAWFNSGPFAVRWPVAPGFIVVSISSLLAAPAFDPARQRSDRPNVRTASPDIGGYRKTESARG